MKKIIADTFGAIKVPPKNFICDLVSNKTLGHERAAAETHRVLAGPSWRETVRIVNRD